MQFTDNALVAQLARKDQQLLHAACRSTVLIANQVLGTGPPGRPAIYFLTGASVALLARAGSRAHVAVGLIGPEGAVGLQHGLGLDAGLLLMMVQTEGAAWRINGAAMRVLLRSRPALLLTVSRYLWAAAQETALFSARVQTQTVVQRLAAWIVQSHGHNAGATLLLTHAHLASMLGVRRPSITSAAVDLRDRGLIDYVRGRIRVLDLAALEDVAHGQG